jgi:hypothetical protein
MNFHEDLSRKVIAKRATNRQFGIVIAVVLGLLGAKLYRHTTLCVVLLALAAVFLVAALVAPRILAPLNAGWSFVGDCLGKVTNPVLITLTYVIGFVPLGLLVRLTGKDPLHRKRGKDAKSYWIEKTEQFPPRETMRRQF